MPARCGQKCEERRAKLVHFMLKYSTLKYKHVRLNQKAGLLITQVNEDIVPFVEGLKTQVKRAELRAAAAEQRAAAAEQRAAAAEAVLVMAAQVLQHRDEMEVVEQLQQLRQMRTQMEADASDAAPA